MKIIIGFYYLFVVLFGILFFEANADTPANCTYEEIRGVWNLYEGPRGQGKDVDCTYFRNFTSVYTVKLDFPNIATDEDGNIGFWTIIYNQGFEVVINRRKYFAFSYYIQNGDNVTSFCNETFESTSHDVGYDPVNWSCFYGIKDDYSKNYAKVSQLKASKPKELMKEKLFYRTNDALIRNINKFQSSWRAGHYDFLNERRIEDVIRMAGGKNSTGFKRPKPTKPTLETLYQASRLPASFDWRNVSGVNYVSPIRDQGSCGSCYAFASMAIHEARIRIRTNNTDTPVLSTQDIIECSPYSQGCDGGFPYLIAGKYAEDYGLVDESCNPYIGVDGTCQTDQNCTRRYGTNYSYIGGFYGASNEPLMRIALVNNGPVAVSFEVYDDFLSYQSGIYHHTGFKDSKNFGFNPWEITNHVVLIVGYGTDQKSGQDYWIVKNSWGPSWGENGFFRILRGTDECAIESISVEMEPVIPN